MKRTAIFLSGTLGIILAIGMVIYFWLSRASAKYQRTVSYQKYQGRFR